MRSFFLVVVLQSMCISPAWAQSEKTSNRLLINPLIDSVNKALQNNYVFPDKAGMMTKHLKARFKAGVYRPIRDPKDLAVQLEKDIHSAHYDGHLRVHYDPEFAQELSRPPSEVVPDAGPMLEREKKDNFSFRRAEILNGNIGYIEFTGFSGWVKEAEPTIRAAFQFVSATDALIIDLRRNGGGSPFMVRHISGYFYRERTRLNDIYERPDNRTVEFWTEPGEYDSLILDMPIYILTSKRTFSAAEDFAYAMKVNGRAIIVGDTSKGGAHPTRAFPVGQGFVVSIPFARSINHITNTDWEGTGVIPDIAVASDEAWRAAQQHFLESKLTTSGNEEEKHRVRWLVDALRAHDYNETTDASLLSGYAGEYGRFRISLENNRLFLHDFVGRKFLMRPIQDDHFLADDWLQIRFIMDGRKVTGMKLMGKPGWVDTYPRL